MRTSAAKRDQNQNERRTGEGTGVPDGALLGAAMTTKGKATEESTDRMVGYFMTIVAERGYSK